MVKNQPAFEDPFPLMTCPARSVDPDPHRAGRVELDYWKLKNIDRACSYCSSMHPSEFLDWCRRCLEPDSKVRIDAAPNSGTRKFYIFREGITDATLGALKCFWFHFKFPMPDGTTETEANRIIGGAIETSVPRWARVLAQDVQRGPPGK